MFESSSSSDTRVMMASQDSRPCSGNSSEALNKMLSMGGREDPDSSSLSMRD
jgi:hypothetical protein